MEEFIRYFRFSPPRTTGREIVITLVGNIHSNTDGTYTVKFGAARCTKKDKFVKSIGRNLAMTRFTACPMEITTFPSNLTMCMKDFNYNKVIESVLSNIAYGIRKHPQYIEHFKN